MRLTAPASCARLVCFLVCLSLLAHSLLPVPAGASGGGAGKSRPAAAKVPAGQEVEAADLPDLDEARRRPRHEPKAVPPVPSTKRRCPPRNPRCNDADGGAPRPAPTPAPQPSPRGHADPPPGLAAAPATSFTSVVGAAFGGRAPLLDLSLLDFYSGGGYSVSDAPTRLSPAAVYAAAPMPAAPYQAAPGRVNVALASAGATATASTTYTVARSYPASGAIDGDRRGLNWGAGGGWNDATPDSYPDWLEVSFPGAKSIDEVDVFTLQDDDAGPSEPTEGMTFGLYGVTAFDVQYWTGSAWATVPGGGVSGNNKVWRRLTFPAVTTEKVRVVVNNSLASYSRLTEVEAWGAGPSLPPGTGLKGEYYNGDNFDSYVLTRQDAAVDFDWGSGSPHLSVDADFFSARWTGTVVPRYTEGYTFYTTTDDGVRLWIDGQLVIDRWFDQAPTEWRNELPVALEAGHAYSIKAEFYEHWGGATARLSWSSARQAKEIVPQSRLYGCCAAPGGGGSGYNFSAARLDPVNRTGGGGVDSYSRNFNFSIPLVSLAGRAGLDLGLTLSYNSLVWTRDAGGVTFDADRGFPSPGFRLGFPVVEPKFVNPQLQAAGQPTRYSYLMLTPSGARVELRQVGTSNVYESADSSYLQLTEGDMTLRSTDGTQLTLVPLGGSYRCTQVKDRNGNFLSVAYYGDGRIDKVTDTLGRVVAFDYDGYQNLERIRQTWKRELEGGSASEGEHEWATFGYEDRTLQPQFSNLAVVGEQPGAVVPVVRWVGLPDGSYYSFEYNGWGQVWKVTRHAATAVDAQGKPTFAEPLTSTWIDLPGAGASQGGAAGVAASPQGDCPRFTKERVWVEHGVLDQSAEVMTTYSHWSAGMASCDITPPDPTPGADASDDVTVSELYETCLWKKGLTKQSEARAGGELKKTTTLSWEHDGASDAAYATNPRVTQTTVSDPQAHTRTTKVTYTKPEDFQGSESGYYDTLNVRMPLKVEECADSNCSDVRRTTVTDYKVANLGQYVSRRILGLARYQLLYDGTDAAVNLRSKVSYVYDDTGHVDGITSQPKFLQGLPSPAWQHSQDDYGVALQWRGNVTRIHRYEVSQQDGAESGAFTESLAGYNVAGAAVFERDAEKHWTTVSYEDAFYAAVNRTHTDPASRLKTYAYPTAVTDPDGFMAWSWYNYDMGVATKVRTQKSNTTANGTDGPVATTFFDGAGRAVKAVNSVNAAHTEWVYEPSMRVVKTFKTVTDESAQDPALRLYSVAVLDGAGRVRGTAGDFAGSTTATPAGSYAAQLVRHDAAGRVAFRSNPTEMRIVDGAWTPAGDDANGGLWRGTTQEYDWKGRPTRTINADGSAKLFEYGGCGCAGGEAVTLTDERGRRQKVYSDPLGRRWKTEVLDWDGNVYSTTTTKYDALDRPLRVRQYAGEAPTEEPAGEAAGYRTTTMKYDGHGRLKERHVPEQDDGRSTVYAYNDDDTVKSVTDARGVKALYEYDNGRHLVSSIKYNQSNVIDGQNVQATADTFFTYDAAGNRKTMADGFGTVLYTYDDLSRLRSEKRTFNDTANPAVNGVVRELKYDYNLAGQLKSLTDPFDVKVNYNYDKAGRLTGVTPDTPFSTGGFNGVPVVQVTEFASGMKYRAWGALKSMGYGNGLGVSLGYTAEMEPDEFKVTSSTGAVMWSKYRRYDDGALKSVESMLDHRFDRAYRYDHAARMEEAFSGTQALSFVKPEPSSSVPYWQKYEYDVWGNTKKRENQYWSRPDTKTFDYDTHNRRFGQSGPLADYDAEGNVVNQGGEVQLNYDGAGRNRLVTDLLHSWVEQWHDGAGRMFKRREERHDDDGHVTGVEVGYYVRSAVLGGAVVSELNSAGGQVKSLVYAGGGVIAELQPNWAVWRNDEPVTGTRGYSGRAGDFQLAEERYDAEGVNVGSYDPFIVLAPPVPDDAGGAWLLGDMGLPSGRCSVDGMRMDCEQAALMMESDTAVQCPANDCGPRRQTVTQRDRHGNILGTSSYLVSQGQAGWDGSLDGTYRVNSFYSTQYSVGTVAGARGLVDFIATGPSLYGESSFGELVQKVAGPPPRPQNPSGPVVDSSGLGPPPPNVAGIRSEIKRMLEKTECADFIKDLLGRVKSDDNPLIADGDILEIYKIINSPPNHGLLNVGEPGTIDGYGTASFRDPKGAATIQVGWRSFGDPAALKIMEAQGILHEIIHQAGKTRVYLDVELAKVVNDMKIPENPELGSPPPGSTEKERTFFYSNYWGKVLDQKCK